MQEAAPDIPEQRPADPGSDEPWVSPPSGAWRTRLGVALSLGLSLTAHAGVLYALSPPAQVQLGEGGEGEPIAVSIVSSVPVALGAQEVAEATDPDEAAAEALKPKEDDPEHPRTEEALLTMPPDPAPPLREAVELPVTPEEPRPEREAQQRQDPAQPSMPAALAASAAPASAGVLREYAKRITSALARTKPRGFGPLGIVRVRFALDNAGKIREAIVVQSSGRDQLDSAALTAVLRTEFPSPPEGMTAAQLVYEVPYHFR